MDAASSVKLVVVVVFFNKLADNIFLLYYY